MADQAARTESGDKNANQQPGEEAGPKLDWHEGPCQGQLGDMAEIKVPKGYRFLDGENTRTLLTLLENITDGSELGTVAPDDANWLAIFEFSPEGYIRDDEKDKIDAAAILNTIKRGTEASNVERKKRGWGTLTVTGWHQAPNYDAQTKNLQWAIAAVNEKGEPLLNYNTRLLGRHGVMKVTLITDPQTLTAALPKFKQLLANYQYTPGNKYGEFRAGDKVAEYGLTALVAGGGLAVAAKSGLLAKLGLLLAKAWKIVVLAVVGVGAFIKKMFSGKQSSA